MAGTGKPKDPKRTSGGRKPSKFITTGGTEAFSGIEPPVLDGNPIPPNVPSQVAYGFWHKLANYSGVSSEWLDALTVENTRDELLARVNRKNGNGTPPVILAARNHHVDLVRWMVDFFGNDINCVRVNNTNLLNVCIESGFPVELCRKVRDQFPELEKSLAGGTLNPHETPCLVFARSGRLIPDDFLHNRTRQYDDLLARVTVTNMNLTSIAPANLWRIFSTTLPSQLRKASQAGLVRCIEIGTGYRFPPHSAHRTLVWTRMFTVCRIFRRSLANLSVRSCNAPHLTQFARKGLLTQVAMCLMDDAVVHHSKVVRMLRREANVMPNLCLMTQNCIKNTVKKVEQYVDVEPEHAAVGERTIKAYNELIPILNKPVHMKRDLIGIRHATLLAILSHRRRTNGIWIKKKSDGTLVPMRPVPKLPSEIWLMVFEILGSDRSMLVRN